MINYRLKIDFLDSKTLASDICFVSGDVKSSTLYFEFYNAGKRVDISGYTLSVRAKRSDGVVVASSGKIKENTAVFTPESNMYCVPGELCMEIALTDATGKYATTKIITAEVIEGLGEAAIEAVDNLNVYVKLISDAISAKEEAKAAAEIAKSVHPEIRDGIWWVYDADQASMVSTGIKAEGPQGIKGEKGDQGIPGYTPQREVDYWTLEDKNSINKYVDDVLEEISDTLNTKIDETSEHLGEEVENLQNQCSNALKGSVNGEVISITDVSPVEHNLGVKVSSKNLANLNQAPLRIFRANIVEQTNDTLKLETAVTGAKWTGAWYELPESLIGEKLTLSGTWEMSNPNSQGAIRIQWIDDKLTTYGNLIAYLNKSGSVGTLTVPKKPEGATKLALIVYAVADSTNAVAGDTVTYKNIQLEKGAAVTAFTPYVDVSKVILSTTTANYTVSADGIVEDVKSIYPNTTLTTDTQGVLIECEYNKDINKAFAELQNAIISLGGNV